MHPDTPLENNDPQLTRSLTWPARLQVLLNKQWPCKSSPHRNKHTARFSASALALPANYPVQPSLPLRKYLLYPAFRRLPLVTPLCAKSTIY